MPAAATLQEEGRSVFVSKTVRVYLMITRDLSPSISSIQENVASAIDAVLSQGDGRTWSQGSNPRESFLSQRDNRTQPGS
jgi:hypothetical protein